MTRTSPGTKTQSPNYFVDNENNFVDNGNVVMSSDDHLRRCQLWELRSKMDEAQTNPINIKESEVAAKLSWSDA